MDSNQLETPSAPAEPTSPDPERPKYRRITRDELTRIIHLNAQGVGQREISRMTGISQGHLSVVLTELTQQSERAKGTLHANQVHAAEAWIKSFSKAIKRGDHRPMKDLLIATGVIDQPQASTQNIIIGIGLTNPTADPFTEAKVVQSTPITTSPAQLSTGQQTE